jgi:hypothetical protein
MLEQGAFVQRRNSWWLLRLRKSEKTVIKRQKEPTVLLRLRKSEKTIIKRQKEPTLSG